jgi:phospholipase/carboxylesterase
MIRETIGGLHVTLGGGTDGNGGGDGPLVVLLHGFGAPGNDLLPIAEELQVPKNVRFAVPEAPLDLGPDMAGGRAWWWIDMMEIQLAQMRGEIIDRSQTFPDGMSEAREAVIAMLDTLVPPGDPTPVVLGGFSQGAMLSCDVVLRTERPFAGLVMMSGTLVAQPEWAPLVAKRKGLRAVVSHGTHDPLLPFSIAERLRDFLAGGGLDVTWVQFRGGHQIPNTATRAVSELVRGIAS